SLGLVHSSIMRAPVTVYTRSTWISGPTTHNLTTATMKRCPKCGYAHIEQGTNLTEVCDRCGGALDGSSVIPDLVHLQNVSLRLAQRITCDEEERQRFGYRLVSSYRFPEIGGRLDRSDAAVTADGVQVMRLSYGDATALYRINLGWAKQRPDQAPGFNLDLERGYWSRNSADEDDQDDAAATGRLVRVVPFVTDTKNAWSCGSSRHARSARWPACKPPSRKRSRSIFSSSPANWPANQCPRRRIAGRYCSMRRQRAGQACFVSWSRIRQQYRCLLAGRWKFVISIRRRWKIAQRRVAAKLATSVCSITAISPITCILTVVSFVTCWASLLDLSADQLAVSAPGRSAWPRSASVVIAS